MHVCIFHSILKALLTKAYLYQFLPITTISFMYGDHHCHCLQGESLFLFMQIQTKFSFNICVTKMYKNTMHSHVTMKDNIASFDNLVKS